MKNKKIMHQNTSTRNKRSDLETSPFDINAGNNATGSRLSSINHSSRNSDLPLVENMTFVNKKNKSFIKKTNKVMCMADILNKPIPKAKTPDINYH